jgi:pilus assembly protein CpaC
MKRSRAVIIASLALALVASSARLQGAPQQESVPAVGQVLHVFVGKSVVINVQARLTRVLSSNPIVVETFATSPTQVVVEGKAAGTSSLILWDEAGQFQMLDVIVDLDVSGLRTAIAHAYPNQQIDVQADGGRLVLSGNVSASHVGDDLIKMAGFYSTQVVNSLTVPVVHDRQVLLEVKFAEVDRTKADQFGINIISTGATNTLGTISTQQFGPPAFSGTVGTPAQGGASNSGFTLNNLLNIFLFRPDINLGATLQDMQNRAILQILAEPNLLALSGQKASFVAGGEFPFPVVQGGTTVGAVTIQFRPFGVKLDFTALIGEDNVVRLHVAPEVSTLDFANAVTVNGTTVPALSTRRAESEIELKDGQSFGIAGLLDRRTTVQISKMPGFGDIPILGQMFRSRSISRSNSELVVIVTPHIVDPVHMEAAAPAEPKPATPNLDIPKFDQNLPGYLKPETPPQPAVPK